MFDILPFFILPLFLYAYFVSYAPSDWFVSSVFLPFLCFVSLAYFTCVLFGHLNMFCHFASLAHLFCLFHFFFFFSLLSILPFPFFPFPDLSLLAFLSQLICFVVLPIFYSWPYPLNFSRTFCSFVLLFCSPMLPNLSLLLFLPLPKLYFLQFLPLLNLLLHLSLLFFFLFSKLCLFATKTYMASLGLFCLFRIVLLFIFSFNMIFWP